MDKQNALSKNGYSFWEDTEKTMPRLELFDTRARQLAETFGARMKFTQIRAFYDQIVRLHQLAQNTNDEDFAQKVLTRLLLLIPQAAYRKERKLVSAEFEEFITESIRMVKTKADLDVLKTHFEAVVGFSKRYAKS